MTRPNAKTLVLSLFPGIGMLDRGFEQEGFCVVKGPDLLWAQDVRGWTAPAGHFVGIIGGSPCPDFSRARRGGIVRDGEGVELMREFGRIVWECQPEWWLLENVERAPTLTVEPFTTQRLDINARECGLEQRRHRHIQFGSRDGSRLAPPRQVTIKQSQATATATEGRRGKGRRTWSHFCALQGVTELRLPSLTVAARYRAVGNGVPLPMARALARAVSHRVFPPFDACLCSCGCGRLTSPGQSLVTAACRQRVSRRRRFGSWKVTFPEATP